MATRPRRRFNVDEYYRMAEAGILGEDDRVELIDGEIVEMTPIGSDHAGVVNRLTHVIIAAMGGRAVVGVQNPVRLGDFSEPQPDLAVLAFRPDYYRREHPKPADVLLLIEVADSSVRFDRHVKLPLYARAGIPETWIVDLNAGTIDVCRSPGPDGYGERRTIGPGDVLTVAALPDVELDASEILVLE
ncbi:MAG: Uma2 family endonuclease [Actinomycetota bacterium]|nr:Uma2 family endonuclease [Actinomycetota bacterium]